MFNKAGSWVRGCVLAGIGCVASVAPALATATLTVPDVDTAPMLSGGNKIMVAVGLFVACTMALRLFKKG